MGDLCCFTRLTVEEPQVEPRRVRTRYLVTSRGRAAAAPLTFSYDEPTLNPADPRARNLARLMVSLPAVNYGLFTEEISLAYPLEAVDTGWLRAMLENTAREIYLNKILGENPYFLSGFRPPTSSKPRRFCRARLTVGGESPPLPPVSLHADRYAVASSGGKESLLSFGLLEELGCRPVPCFFNESGRHWYTALNAYRHFSAEVPRTRRVWSDVDRLYAFMLRQMPFIRPDFQRIQADIYPIRLFTVEVMAMAFVPICLQGGLGNLVIGSEFDTTVYGPTAGTYHYHMTYDQSRGFDEVMTALFRRKGLRLRQFSLVRPLSELLVEQILGRRYPHLLRLQTSCHSAHLRNGRARPCGRCEKCQRVLALLLVSGLDARHLAYRAADVRALPERLRHTRLHQERAASTHLRSLLAGLDGDGARASGPRPHPEIEYLRFDRTHARWDGVPAGLRARLYRIMLQHARGALERRRGRWVPFDPLGSAPGPPRRGRP